MDIVLHVQETGASNGDCFQITFFIYYLFISDIGLSRKKNLFQVELVPKLADASIFASENINIKSIVGSATTLYMLGIPTLSNTGLI